MKGEIPAEAAVRELFLEALDVPAAERVAFVAARCGGDGGLLQAVLGLLGALEGAGEYLSLPQGSPEAGPGDRIGPYRLLERIGEGGFGLVYMAEQEQPIRRRVALKVLRPGMGSGQVLARFEAERQALAMMDHPNIAKVLDAGTTGSGSPYFVMELVRGEPITTYCDQNRLSPRDRLALIAPVCRAVQHAHMKGVIHRDIKPGNVLVTLHDGRPVPKVIDFGIAKAVQEPLTDRTLFTEFRAFVGTPAYMSPEQAEMSGLDIDTRSDVYSLGVLLYELLTGSTPFDSERLMRAGVAEIQRIIREEEPARPSTRVSTMGARLSEVAECRRTEPARLGRLMRGEVDWIVMRAMEKERVRRYETAESLAADLERYLQGLPVLAGPPGALYKVRRYAVRHRGTVAAAALILAALVLGLGASLWGFLQAASDRDASRAAERRESLARQDADRLLAVAEAREGRYRSQADNARVGLDLIDFGVGIASGAGFSEGGDARDLTVRQMLDVAAGKIGAIYKDRPRLEAAARRQLGHTYNRLARPKEAVEQLTRALELWERHGPPDEPTLIAAYIDLESAGPAAGGLMWAREPWMAKKLPVSLRYLEGEAPGVAPPLRRMWEELNVRSSPSEARIRELHAGMVSAIRDSGLTADSPATPILADAWLSVIRWRATLQRSDAIIECVVAALNELDARFPTLPEQSTATLSTRNALLFTPDLHLQAEILRQCEILRTRELRAFNPEHWLVGFEQCGRATALARLGRTDEARPIMVEGYNRIINHLGGRSYDGATAFTLVEQFSRIIRDDRVFREVQVPPDLPLNAEISALVHGLGGAGFDAEMAALTRALRAAPRAPEDVRVPLLRPMYEVLAACYQRPCDTAVLRDLCDTLADCVPGAVLSERSARVNAMAISEICSLRLRDFARAEAVVRVVLAERRAMFGEEFSGTNYARMQLGQALAGLGRAAEAEPLLLEAYERLGAAEGFASPVTHDALESLVAIWQARSELDRIGAQCATHLRHVLESKQDVDPVNLSAVAWRLALLPGRPRAEYLLAERAASRAAEVPTAARLRTLAAARWRAAKPDVALEALREAEELASRAGAACDPIVPLLFAGLASAAGDASAAAHLARADALAKERPPRGEDVSAWNTLRAEVAAGLAAPGR